MKIFALLTIVALIGGSQAMFLDSFTDIFHNLGQELGEVGKDLLHTATPIATNLLEALKQGSTQLLSTAASDLLSKLSGATSVTASPVAREIGDLSKVMSKIEAFVKGGEKFIEEAGGHLHSAYINAIQKIQEEIEHVKNGFKPISGLVNEVKSIVEGHNNFVEELVKQAYPEAVHLFQQILGEHSVARRDLLGDIVGKFSQSISGLLQQVTAPLTGGLNTFVQNLETKLLGLLG